MKKSIIALSLGVSLGLITSHAQATDIVVNCGATVDVEKQILTGPRSFEITDGRITAVDSAATGAQAVDLTDSTCLPGLIDMHVHLTSQSSPRSYLDTFTQNTADYAFKAVKYARRYNHKITAWRDCTG